MILINPLYQGQPNEKNINGFVFLIAPVLAIAGGAGYGNTKWDMFPTQVVSAQGNGAHLISPEKFKGSFGKVRIDMYRLVAICIPSHSYLIILIASSKRTLPAMKRKMKGLLLVNLVL